MDEFIKLIEQIVTLGTQHAWVPLASVVIGLLVRLVKSDALVAWFPVTIEPRYRALVAVLLGIVSGVLDKVVTGTGLVAAIVGGLLSAFLAISSHDVVIEGLRGGRELGTRKQGGPPMFPLVMLALCLTATSCTAAQVREVKTVVRDVATEVIEDADQAIKILDVLHTVADIFFLAKPDAAVQAQIEQYFADAKLAALAAVDVAKGANAGSVSDYNAAFGQFRNAYDKLMTVLNDLGIVGKASGAKMSANRRGGGTNEIPVPRAAMMKAAK